MYSNYTPRENMELTVITFWLCQNIKYLITDTPDVVLHQEKRVKTN